MWPLNLFSSCLKSLFCRSASPGHSLSGRMSSKRADGASSTVHSACWPHHRVKEWALPKFSCKSQPVTSHALSRVPEGLVLAWVTRNEDSQVIEVKGSLSNLNTMHYGSGQLPGADLPTMALSSFMFQSLLCKLPSLPSHKLGMHGGWQDLQLHTHDPQNTLPVCVCVWWKRERERAHRGQCGIWG